MLTQYIEKKDLIELIKKKNKNMLNKELSLKLIEISGDCQVRGPGLGNSSKRSTINIESDRTDIKLGYNTK